MRKKTPLLEKTPFAIEQAPMQGALTANGGLAAVSRVLRSLAMARACQSHLKTKAQGELFAGGNEYHYHAVLTNRWDMDGGELLTWNRAKAGAIEHVHDEMKNGLAAGQMPSGKLGANAA